MQNFVRVINPKILQMKTLSYFSFFLITTIINFSFVTSTKERNDFKQRNPKIDLNYFHNIVSNDGEVIYKGIDELYRSIKKN